MTSPSRGEHRTYYDYIAEESVAGMSLIVSMSLTTMQIHFCRFLPISILNALPHKNDEKHRLRTADSWVSLKTSISDDVDSEAFSLKVAAVHRKLWKRIL